TRWDETAEREGFLLLIPQALPLDPARPAHFRRNPAWWNDGSPVGGMAKRAIDDVAFLTALLDEVGDRSVFVTGFSNGAGMAFRLAAERANRLRAIAPIAGYSWVDVERVEPALPTFYLVGKEDPVVPLDGGSIVSPWGWVEDRPAVRDTIDRWARALGGRA